MPDIVIVYDGGIKKKIFRARFENILSLPKYKNFPLARQNPLTQQQDLPTLNLMSIR